MLNKTGDALLWPLLSPVTCRLRDAAAPEYCYRAAACPLEFALPDAARDPQSEPLCPPVLFSVKTRAKEACLQLALEDACNASNADNADNAGNAGNADSVWSKPVPINSLGLASFCEAVESDGRREVCYSVHISRAPGAFARTRVVTITPAFVAVNQTATPLRLRQAGTPESLVLPPGEAMPFHWPRADLPHRLQALPSAVTGVMTGTMTGATTGTMTGATTGTALGWSSAFSPECSSFVLPFFPAAFEAPTAWVVTTPCWQQAQQSYALRATITSSLGALFLFVEPCATTLFPVAVQNATAASVVTVRQCGAPWSTALQLQPWESQPWALPLLEAPAEVEVSVRCVGEEPGGESLRPCLRVSLDGQEGETTLATEMETIRVCVAVEGCARVLRFQAERGRASQARLIRWGNAVEDVQAAKRQEAAMCAESLETPADGEAALVLHLVYGFDTLAKGCTAESAVETVMESALETATESAMEVEVVVGGERHAFSATGSEFHLLDGVLLCALSRACFSVRLSGEMPREAECECDLAQLVAEAPNDAIQEVVVPCTEVGGQRTLCRLWVRLFRARSRGAARLEYEIACLARQKAEVRRAADRLEEEQKKVISGLATPRSPFASEPTTPMEPSMEPSMKTSLEPSLEATDSGDESRMNVCVLLHAVRSIPCGVALEAPYAVVTLGRTRLRSPCGVVDADEALWANPSVVVKCRSAKNGFSLRADGGVLRVCRVDQNSLAEHAGLRVGHVLASVNRAKPPCSVEEFARFVSRDFSEKYLQFIAPPRRALQRVVLEQRLFFPRGGSVGERQFTVELFDERREAEDVLLLRAALPLPRDGNADWSESVCVTSQPSEETSSQQQEGTKAQQEKTKAQQEEAKAQQEKTKAPQQEGMESQEEGRTANDWCISVGVSWSEEKAEEEVMAWSARVALKGLQLSVVDAAPREILLVTVDQIVGECGVFETGRRCFRGRVGAIEGDYA